MGKKSKRRAAQAARANASNTETKELSKAAKKEVYELIQQLFESKFSYKCKNISFLDLGLKSNSKRPLVP